MFDGKVSLKQGNEDLWRILQTLSVRRESKKTDFLNFNCHIDTVVPQCNTQQEVTALI